MYLKKQYKIRGIVPTMPHNGRLANPLDVISKELKKFTSKKTKTDEDHITMAQLEWLGSFYPDQPGTFEVKGNTVTIAGFGRPVYPGENIEQMLISAAKKNKRGQDFKVGVMVDGDFPILYDGPPTIEALFGNPKFIDRRGAGVSRSTIMRSRPIFHDWRMQFTASYLPDVVDVSALDQAVEIAGLYIGLSDYRPKFGRFVVES